MNVAAAVVGGALMLGVAVTAGKGGVDPPKKAAASKGAVTTSSTAPGDLVEFRDRKAGWAISYPKSWNRLQSPDADVVLVSENPPELNTGGSILARDLILGAPVDESKLQAAKEVTDKIVTGGEGIRLLAQPAIVNQGGLPGYFYFYSFKDPTTGQEGVHSHYFLFKGSTMISFVFQALPKEKFQALAHLYDEVIGSFKGEVNVHR